MMFLKNVKYGIINYRFFNLHAWNDVKSLALQRAPYSSKSRKKSKAKDENLSTELKNLNFHVLGTGAEGTGASLLCFTSNPILRSFLFNCGEGTIRSASENDEHLTKIKNIYITSNSWKNIGGLVGLCNLFKVSSVESIKIHGPPGIEDILNDYIWFQTPFLEYCEHKESKTILNFNNEDFMKVIPIIPENETRDNYDTALSYKFTLPKFEGEFLLEKCVELNVPPGPLLLDLKNGKDVLLEDGTLIKSSEVRVNHQQPITIWVVDLPSKYHLESVIKNEIIPEENTDYVVHFTPNKILQSEEYKSWMRLFGKSSKHLIINDANKCIGLRMASETQQKLHLLSYENFPIFRKVDIQNNSIWSDFDLIYPTTGFKIPVRGNIGKNDQYSNSVDNEFNCEEDKEIILECKENFKNIKINKTEYPHVVFLGTISSTASPYRNTSGLLLRISEHKSILLDCGEGTYGQLVHFYGLEETQNILRNLAAIYISHKHVDHQLGLFGILIGRKNAFIQVRQEKIPSLPVLIPPNIQRSMAIAEKIIDDLSDTFHNISNMEYLYLSRKEKSKSALDVLTDLELSDIQTTFVEHCKHSYGISLLHKTGWKIVYSGDTMPSDHLVKIGHGCDLLIHEATFEDYLKEDASKKKHSTTSEAIEISKQMKAKNTVLTHFSVRYNKLPMIYENIPGIAVAFDFMKVCLEDPHRLYALYPAFETVFNEDYTKNKDKTFRKLRENAINKNGFDSYEKNDELYRNFYG